MTFSNIMLLAPAPCGWRALASTGRGEWLSEECASLAEAFAAGRTLAGPPQKGAGSPQVAIPVRLGIFERLTLPSTDREELDSMVRLQFEKNLPYPMEETALAFQVLAQDGGESTVMACAVHEPALKDLFSALPEHTVPQCLTFWAMHVAAQAPAEGVACGFWQEEEKVIFGIFEKGRLGYVETLGGSVDELRTALPGMLMRAQINGVPANFTEVLLDPALESAGAALGAYFGLPVRPIAEEGGDIEGVDLTPEAWRAGAARRDRVRGIRRRVAAAAVAYLVAVAGCLGYLAVEGRELGGLRSQAAALQPQVDAAIERQSRWKVLAPAVDNRRFAVEELFQVWQCLPSVDTRITRFELGRNQLTVEGEAPNAQQAIQFGEKLKAKPELADFRFDSGPPSILPNEHAQFRIFGKQ